MDKAWTHSDIQRLVRMVAALLDRTLTTQDLPHVRFALSEQQTLLDLCFRLLGRQAEELETLRRLVRDGDEPQPWDQDDDREW